MRRRPGGPSYEQRHLTTRDVPAERLYGCGRACPERSERDARAPGSDGALQVDLFGGADAGAQFDFMPELRQDNLERGQHGELVQRVVITQVSQPEDLAPHGALSVGDDRS